jgi:hypothetical protein
LGHDWSSCKRLRAQIAPAQINTKICAGCKTTSRLAPFPQTERGGRGLDKRLAGRSEVISTNFLIEKKVLW